MRHPFQVMVLLFGTLEVLGCLRPSTPSNEIKPTKILNCCDRIRYAARENPDSVIGVSLKGVMGKVICCKGKTIPCSFWPNTRKMSDQIIRRCISAHERLHLADVENCDRYSDLGIPDWKSHWTERLRGKREVQASQVEFACIDKALRAGKCEKVSSFESSSACQEALEKRKQRLRIYAVEHGGTISPALQSKGTSR